MKKKFDKKKTSFGYRFALLHRLQASICRKDIIQAGLRPSHLPFLLELVQEDSAVTQDSMSRQIAIDKGTTARAVSQMEKAGFVTRITNPENRRQNLVSATSKAYEVAATLFASLDHAAEIFVQGFSDEELATVLNLMDRMIANAKKVLGDDSGQEDRLNI